MHLQKRSSVLRISSLCLILLLFLSACDQVQTAPPKQAAKIPPTATATATAPNTNNNLHFPQKPTQAVPTPTPVPQPTSTPVPAGNNPQNIQPLANDHGHPVLAFYYPWYIQQSWTLQQMSDLPSVQYNSGDDVTIDRQLNFAAGAGITGFISSWWGAGDKTDVNFGKLLVHAATLEQQANYHFASSLYMECDAPNLNTPAKMASGLTYVRDHYSNDAHFFHWQGKPVLFFWSPLGNGRTLAQWASIRQQVDPNHQMIWSAEGVDTNLLSVFDGLHLFSAGYWGLKNNTMPQVDQGFRDKITAYNQANNTQKIWAAGVMPGYDDTRVPGRKGTFTVPRNNGTTYTTSWNAAIASNPEWITITSFNEWFEGAMIEPSVTYGNQYLTLTQQFAHRWHG
ncbi:hypothetical protein KDA_28790 [Dictyobacter alpinus]|uniref:GH26 domain-containing protein n=1 Tax=Dictyobacter alpinus TaxID=2014873 RepID=A0A402B7Q7_9CHLR|nr:glycoside hydrolase family 99-like domain-containing protein [Dictyobacter alpinus]GCE27395.1 hypothetical protein KDA_28790 [Dictyobacter alpinus]